MSFVSSEASDDGVDAGPCGPRWRWAWRVPFGAGVRRVRRRCRRRRRRRAVIWSRLVMTPRAAGGLDEAADGVDLGAHRAGGEVAVGGVAAQLRDGQPAERLGVGRAPADRRRWATSVAMTSTSAPVVSAEQGGAEVLVDDGLDAGAASRRDGVRRGCRRRRWRRRRSRPRSARARPGRRGSRAARARRRRGASPSRRGPPTSRRGSISSLRLGLGQVAADRLGRAW